MNYGYTPSDTEPPLELPPQEVYHRYPLQLYHYLATKVPVAGKDLLEVGSGRGGGSRYIAQYHSPHSMIGMDLAQNAVDFSNRVHHAPNLKYVQGNAENLPFADNSFDVVINVESCHAYGSVSKFLAEVKRVLRPGGYLCITDMRGVPGLEKLNAELNSAGMNKIFEDDITEQVVAAIELDETNKWNQIKEAVPARYHKMFGEFAGVAGSQIHLQLKERKLIYCRWVFQKQ
ncbi:MAG TPA: class I SAM-dependent methyltransferase [Phnomibacter sp.]|nr:class I SAM-dependent methyltransferase [Phnomibacter sp.]